MEDIEKEEGIINNKYKIIDKLGEGTFGVVFYVKKLDSSNQEYAVKVLRKNIPDDIFKKKIKLFNKINNLNSQYIIRYIESDINASIKWEGRNYENAKFFVLEYASKKTLLYYLEFPNESLFKEEYAKIIFKKISRGVQRLHEGNFCHRDLKLENILLSGDYEIKICDFSFTNYNRENFKSKAGTPGYCAPEIEFLDKEKGEYDGKKADIYSLGVILFQLLLGIDYDFILIKTNEFDKFLQDHNLVISPLAKELILGMTNKSSKKRFTINQVINHPWLININENDLTVNNNLKKEFERREKLVNEISYNNLKNNCFNKEESDYINYFKNNFNLEIINDNNLSWIDYIKIKDDLEDPKEFMNFIGNKINKKFKEYIDNENKMSEKYSFFEIKENEEYFIFDIYIKYASEENNHDLKENSKEINGNDDEEVDINLKEYIKATDLEIEISLLKTYSEDIILKFYKKSGAKEDYYKKLAKIISFIQ